MEKKLLMVDMDDVIYLDSFIEVLEEFLGKNITKEACQKIGYYLQNLAPDKDAFFNYLFERNLYDYGHIAPKCKELLEVLNEQYHLFILTSYIFIDDPYRSGILLDQKHRALLDNFPFLTPNNFIFANDKSICHPDIMIDDKVSNLSTAKRKLLFSSYHNLDIPELELKGLGIERVLDWEEVGKILIKK